MRTDRQTEREIKFALLRLLPEQTKNKWKISIQEEIYEIMGEEVNLYLAGVNRFALNF